MSPTGAMITNFRPSSESSSEMRVINLVPSTRTHNSRTYSRSDRLFSRRNADDSDSEADTREMDSRMSIRNIDRCENAVIVSFPDRRMLESFEVDDCSDQSCSKIVRVNFSA